MPTPTKPKKKKSADVLIWGVPVKQVLTIVLLVLGALTGKEYMGDTKPRPMILKFYNREGKLVPLPMLEPATKTPAADQPRKESSLPPLPGDP